MKWEKALVVLNKFGEPQVAALFVIQLGQGKFGCVRNMNSTFRNMSS